MLPSLRSLTDIANIASGSTQQILTVPIGDVVSKEQVRKKFENIDELAASMKVEGQQSPITVSAKNKDGKYVIQKGERRWRALNVAGSKTIDIIVRAVPKNRIEEIAGELIENIQRDDLKAMEIAEGMGILMDEGLSRKQIGERLGKSPTYVSIMLSLRKVPRAVRKLYDEDLVTDPNTLYTLKQIYEEDAIFGEKVCGQAKRQGGISRTKARELLTSLKAGAGDDDPGGQPVSTTSSVLSSTPGPAEHRTAHNDGKSQAAERDKPKATSSGKGTKKDGTQQENAVSGHAQEAGSADGSAAASASESIGQTQALSVQVQIRVEVAFPNGDATEGILLLDRADQDPGFGLVKFDDKTDAMRIEVEQIRILEVRAAN